MNDLIKQIHANAINKGFWENDNMGEKLALVHSEVSEALDALRLGNEPHFAEELADVVIRCMDIAGYKGIDLEAEIKAKHNKNLSRPRLHGKKF